MLTKGKKMYFEEALMQMKLPEVEKRVKDCISALLPNKRERLKFWQRMSMDPRKDDT